MSDVLKEQQEWDRAQKDRRYSAIILCGLEDLSMPLDLIAERFGETPGSVRHILNAAGVPREADYFADSYNGRRRMAG